tara:strand:- start:3507 stop:3962 length:456 start_codon:yes stop_codon:yes gene_type:complete
MTDKTKNQLLNEIQHLRDDLLLRAETVQEMYKKNKELELKVRNLLDGKEIKALLEDAHLVEIFLVGLLDEKEKKIKELQAHHDEVLQATKERYMERIDEKDTEIRDLHEWTTAGDKMIAAKNNEIGALRHNSAKVREALRELLILADTRER